MQTFTGTQFWPLDPHTDDIDILDIAHALSHTCRYGGHCQPFYSVAEHCVIMAGFASEPNKLAALLHDAPEAYLVDVPRPIKPYLPNYYAIEARLAECIAERFGLATLTPPEVVELDHRILSDEKAQLMSKAPADWGLTYPPLNAWLPCFEPRDAEQVFLSVFHRFYRGM